jgi:hypothetical protein
LNKKKAQHLRRSAFSFPSHTHSHSYDNIAAPLLSNVYIQHAGLLSTQQERDKAAAAQVEKKKFK